MNLLGQILHNQFRVDAFVAAGGMGAVYRVWDMRRNTALAMKVLHAEFADDPAVFKRFQREALVLQTLAHPNVVPFYGIFQAGEIAYLLERFVDGPTLKQILAARPGRKLQVYEALTCLKAVCAALGYAHSTGVVHCDMKPGNILLDQGGALFVTDFGIARFAENATTTLATSGTAAYMAPEQVRGEAVDPRTDIYALGVTLFELLTGQRPFRGEETGAHLQGAPSQTANERIRFAHLNQAPPHPRSLDPAIPEELAQVILRALAKDPAARFASMEEFFTAACAACSLSPGQVGDRLNVALPGPGVAGGESTLASLSTAGGVIPPPPFLPPAHRRNWLPWALAGGAALILCMAVVVVGGLFLLNSQPANSPETRRDTSTPRPRKATPEAAVASEIVASPLPGEPTVDAGQLSTAAARTVLAELTRNAPPSAVPTAIPPTEAPIPATHTPRPTSTTPPTPPPSATPRGTPTRTPHYPLSGCAPSRLQIGDVAHVAPVGGRNAIRSTADTHPSDNILYYVDVGSAVEIIGGPVCNYGWLLWEVRISDNGDEVTGWTPEGDTVDYFLDPVEPWEACSGARKSRLHKDESAYVSFDPPYANNVRSRADKSSTLVGQVMPGEVLRVIDGPSCANNWVWWKVVSAQTGLTGWTSEGDSGAYWLTPLARE